MFFCFFYAMKGDFIIRLVVNAFDANNDIQFSLYSFDSRL